MSDPRMMPPQQQQPQVMRPQERQPPAGSTGGATTATANRGNETAAVKQVGLIIDGLTGALPLAGPGSELGKAILESIRRLAPFVPPGAVTPQDKINMIQSMAIQVQQQAQRIQAMRQGQAQAQQQQRPGVGGAAQPMTPSAATPPGGAASA